MLDRYEEAILAFKKAISISPESPYYHSYLAANYFLTGREKKAQAEIAKVMEIDPKFSSEACRTGELYKDEDYLNRLIDAMRKAGLPERPPLKMPDKPSLDNDQGDINLEAEAVTEVIEIIDDNIKQRVSFGVCVFSNLSASSSVDISPIN